MSRILFRITALSTIFVAIVAMNHLAVRSRAGAPLPTAQHGLTGNYYISNWDKDVPPPAGPYAQVWHDPNDFSLPKIFTPPVASRVDAQVAFGQGKGFSAKNPGPPVIWWPAASALPAGWTAKNVWDYFAAVIWKGYIHLPKAGTYYFATVSNGASAVYINQARVALNGNYGGVLVGDAFDYSREQVLDFVDNLFGGRDSVLSQSDPRYQYVVPVSIDAPRDVPIEVHYNPSAHFTHRASEPFGIDLFWVMPDSPRDANGKHIASIVPSDALYTEAPGPIEKPVVRSANSTISADFLYFYLPSDKFVTLTVRLADKDGNPVAGKRVYLNSLNAWKADPITQPEKPTDADGMTTARIRADLAVQHDSSFFATDVTDFVDVAQVAHISFLPYVASFFPQSFSPYYDPRGFRVEPLPMQVGKPLTITVPLENGGKYPGEVSITFKRNDWNIGVPVWNDAIGEVKNVHLNPHEHKDVSITWTPKQESSHQCFRVELQGHWIVSGIASVHPLVASVQPALAWQAGRSQNVPANDSKQQNIGAVQAPHGTPTQPNLPPCASDPQWYPPLNHTIGVVKGHEGGLVPCTPSSFWKKTAADLRQRAENYLISHCARTAATYLGGSGILPRGIGGRCAEALDDIDGLNGIVNDPPDSSYRRLAVAASDSPGGYLQAWTKSWERYQAARAENDAEWMAKHVTAIQLYVRHYVKALRRDADGLQKEADRLAPDDPKTIADLHTEELRLKDWLGHGAQLTPDQLKQLLSAGVSETQARKMVNSFIVHKDDIVLKSDRTLAMEGAALYRQAADEVDQLDVSPTAPEVASEPGLPLVQTYSVGNPHDRPENVDLFIRSISVPPDWKLSIVNAEYVEGSDQTGKVGGSAPKFPVREVEAGKHYTIDLPTKAEAKVASLVVPVGEIGARTTARWAVEGKIGNQLIGGMVHEMNVPYIIPDLQLPPVGSKEVEEEVPVPGRPWSRLVAEVAAAIIVLGLLMFLFIFLRRRRRTTTEI